MPWCSNVQECVNLCQAVLECTLAGYYPKNCFLKDKDKAELRSTTDSTNLGAIWVGPRAVRSEVANASLANC